MATSNCDLSQRSNSQKVQAILGPFSHADRHAPTDRLIAPFLAQFGKA